MREIEVGIRYDLKNPPTFFGLEEVNSMLEKGAKIVSLQPGSVLARKLGENAETSELSITGFALKVQLREADERPEE